jgi:hypothetical protein
MHVKAHSCGVQANGRRVIGVALAEICSFLERHHSFLHYFAAGGRQLSRKCLSEAQAVKTSELSLISLLLNLLECEFDHAY